MEEGTPWRNLGVIGLRLVDLAARYALVFALTWAAVAGSLPDGISLGEDARDWLGFFTLIGVPSVLISFLYGLANTRTGAAFRGPLAALLLLPLWFLLFFPPILLIPVIGQLVFALCVVRAPFLGPSRLRRRARAALAAVARVAGTRTVTPPRPGRR
ncbi:hypothetical protein [Streptomyces sp. NPDC093225]|uniref:hypothetical protein n=1 Tax=Streptomyces sp. NPDC093225 TaxID=3366034 RepID=UPI00381E54E1